MARSRPCVAAAGCLAGLGLAVGLAGQSVQAQTPATPESQNRDGRPGRAVRTLTEPVTEGNAALRAFAAGRPDLAVSVDDTFGVTSKLYDRLDYLTGPDPRDPSTIALDFITTNLAVLGLDQADLAEYEVTDLAVNQATGSAHLYLRQTFQGIPLYNGLLQVNVNREWRIMSVNNAWVRGLAAAANAAAPGVSAGNAVANAAAVLELETLTPPGSLGPPEGEQQVTRLDPTGISVEPLEAELMWLPVAGGEVRLVWNFQVHTADRAHVYDLTVDASSGAIWTQADMVKADSYTVYAGPAESPIHVSPTPPSDGRTVVTNPANATASPYGWHDTNGATGAEYTIMRGNNVHAYDDIDKNNASDVSVSSIIRSSTTATVTTTNSPGPYDPLVGHGYSTGDLITISGADQSDYNGTFEITKTGATTFTYTVSGSPATPATGTITAIDEPDCGASLNCTFAVDLTAAPSAYKSAAVANLFYWNNHIHDVQYQYGFTETAGNFQVNNYGKGGSANDDVRAEALDGGGTNNANMMTPSDGGRPRMQMYVWTYADPDRTSDFDNGIIIHEYGHGISTRLVGGPSSSSCLWNTQQPGEGLSDWWALAYTAETGDAGTDGRGVGTYSLNEATTGRGIRGQRYSTDPSINTWTYESMNGLSVPHGVGSVWAQVAWEMYWTLVDAHGFDANLMNGSGTAGNQRAMLYVNEGLMNTSCSPTFPDVRDGIIQAVIDNHGGVDTCRVWETFAAYGLGTNAISGGSSSSSPTNGYGRPLACLSDVPALALPDISVTEGDSGNTTAAFAVTLSAASSYPVTVDYATANGTAVTLFTTSTASNTTALTIPGSGTGAFSGAPASVYPSTITVSTTVTLSDVNVTLTGFNHTWPADIDILLVGPTGASVVLMSDVGGGTDAVDATLTFDDAGSSMSAVITGTYAPTNSSSGDNFPSPAPSGTPGSALAVFNGTNSSGTWSLYIVDDYFLDVGTLTGGWSLTLSTPAADSDYTAASGRLTFAAGTTSQTVNVTVLGDTDFESNETFVVNLSDAANATIGDAQGIGTILADDGAGPGRAWTDDPLTAGNSTLKAVHITELRTRIEVLRTLNGLDAFSWTDGTLTAGVTLAKAIHVEELRTALGAVYTALDQSAPSYTDPTLSSGMTIKAVHISELRIGIVAVE